MKIKVSFFIYLILSVSLISQETAAQKIYSSTNKQAIRNYESGLELYEDRENSKARNELLKAVSQDPALLNRV